MRHSVLALTMAAVLGSAVGAAAAVTAPGPGHVVVVKMVKQGNDYRFSPAAVTVQPGDTLRWLQASDAPHNVQLDSWPKGARVGNVRMGPYLTSPGQSYQLVVDERFTAGTYAYECTPHGAMGMKATVTVAPAAQ